MSQTVRGKASPNASVNAVPTYYGIGGAYLLTMVQVVVAHLPTYYATGGAPPILTMLYRWYLLTMVQVAHLLYLLQYAQAVPTYYAGALHAELPAHASTPPRRRATAPPRRRAAAPPRRRAAAPPRHRATAPPRHHTA